MNKTKLQQKSKGLIILFFAAVISFIFLLNAYPASALKEGESSYFLTGGECIKATVLDLDPVQLKFEESNLCGDGTKEGFFLADNECFEVTAVTGSPGSFKIEETELSKCVETVSYKIVGDVCFKIEVLELTPNPKIKMSEAPMADCVTPVDNKDNPGSGSDGGTKSKKTSSTTTKPATPAYDDAACKKKLKKQTCVMGYRTYNCESFNVDGKYKEYKEECASCSNKMKDNNENGIDCGGICPAKCAVTVTTPVDAQASAEPAITTEPAAEQEQEPTQTEASSLFNSLFSKWLIPILGGLVFFAIVLGIVLWLALRSKPAETKTTGASSKGSITPVSALSASSEPKGSGAKVKAAAAKKQKPLTAKKKAKKKK